MKEKFKIKFDQLKEFYKKHPKRFWVIGIIVVIAIFIALPSSPKVTVTLADVAKTDLKETVLATGQVTSNTDLDLAFSTSDVVRSVNVAVGTKVYQGQVLAALDNADKYAALKAAQAKYNKVAEGASTEDVAVSEAALHSAQTDLLNTQKTQDTLVENAHRALLNTNLTPILSSGSSGTAPSITGTYTDTTEGSYTVNIHTTGGGPGYFTYTGLESGTGSISTTSPSPLGTKGLYIQFPTDYASHLDNVWTVLLPNTKSASFLSDSIDYQNALKNRDSAVAAKEAAVNEREADLNLKKAAARPADLDLANADVLAASAAYEKTVLRAPAAGTITSVDIKIGEQAVAQKEAMILQDVSNLYVEAKINEASIAKVVLGQSVSMTFDAFGPDKTFSGKVVHIDPSASTEDGVVNYKIKSSIDTPPCNDKPDCIPLSAIRPGMNANIIITASDKPGVIAVPKAAITQKDGKSYVNIVTNEKRKKYAPREITTGSQGDGNLVEVVSGLSEGEKIAVVTK